MDAVSVPYIPTSLWILAGATTILILLAAFGFYIYWRKWATELAGTGSSVASLDARKAILEKDIEALRLWIDDQKGELDRLGAEREDQERLRAVLADLEQQCAGKNQENQTLRNEVGELENQRHNLGQSLERMQREIGDLDAKKAEAQALESRLAELRSRLDEAQQTIRNLAELEIKLNGLSNEKISLERAVEDLRTAAESARTESNRFKGEAAQVRAEFEKSERALTQARKEKAESEVIIDTLRHEQNALENSVERLENKIEELESDFRNAQEEVKKKTQQTRQAESELERISHDLSVFQKDRQRVELEVGELNARKAVLEREILKMDTKLGSRREEGEDELAAYSDLLEKRPLCLERDSFSGKRDEQDETLLLQEVRKALRQDGLIFSPRIIDAFHTSLKCHDINPITVLAGVSGTGKTLLPVRYAEIMGMHRLVMAVQPRWDSPQDMFGFYNYLEKEYKATELSRVLVRMDPYNYPENLFPMLQSRWAQDRLLLVLMDEMNLARTEYYFSEFLSRLELRRAVKDPASSAMRSEAEIELDAGPGKHRFRIWVQPNVFFVGTMNEDETTQTLSDKVLDRANVLRFGKPDENAKIVRIETGRGAATSPKYLSYTHWERWKRDANENSDWYDYISKWTVRINAALNRVGRPFGFRVLQAIGHYVSNYPRVEDGERHKLAFADQVEQKIIPKIRGIDLSTDNANECLSEVESIISELGDTELSDAFSTARSESRMVGTFQWRGVTRRAEEDQVRHAH
jgi:peptidoglycan hydrolase CwlO-like protein